MKEQRNILFVGLDGTAYNLENNSLVSQFFKELQIPEIRIRPNEDFPTVAYIERSDGDDSLKCDKVYLPGPGAAGNGQYHTPGKKSPFLNQDKDKISQAISRETKDQKISSAGLEEFLGATSAPDPERGRLHRFFDNHASDGLLRLVNGMINGEGREQNVQTIATLVSNVSYKKIIIFAWSRGAATALHTAKVLYDMGFKIPVYLFEKDTVTGRNVGLTDENVRYITPNVKVCTSLIALDDLRKEFNPQSLEQVITLSERKPADNTSFKKVEDKKSEQQSDLEDPIIPVIDDSEEDQDDRIINFYPVHGSHGQLADSQQTNPTPAQITRYHWEKFLSHVVGEKIHRSLVPDYKNHNPQEILESYAETQFNAEKLYQYEFSLWDKAIYTKEPRPITRNLRDYTSRPHLFVNADHQDLFVFLYPDLYGHIISGTATVEQIQRSDLGYYSKRMNIANVLLKPLQDELDRIPKDNIYVEYKNQLAQLHKIAKNEILSKLPVDNSDLTDDKTLSRTLNNIPKVQECRDAAKMNRAIFDSRKNYAQKCRAVENFENSSRTSTAKKVIKAAVQLLGRLISFAVGAIALTVFSPLLLLSMRNNAPAVYKATKKIAKMSNNTYNFITESSLSRKVSKMLEATASQQKPSQRVVLAK